MFQPTHTVKGLRLVYMVIIVWLGPGPSPWPKAWFGPKHNTKIDLHTTTHHTNLLTSSRVDGKLKVSMSS